jgi:hypothetical protein
MGVKPVFFIVVTLVLTSAEFAFAVIRANTNYMLDLTNAKEAAKKAKWSDPDRFAVTAEGLGLGGSRSAGQPQPLAADGSHRDRLVVAADEERVDQGDREGPRNLWFALCPLQR